MSGNADGFLSRWSRRKVQARDASPAPVAEPKAPSASPAATADDAPVVVTPAPLAAPSPVEAAPADPSPTLEDVAHLTPESHFGRFVQPDVAPAVRNAALKKLFADPQFNVMDGLDTYIDDYGKPDPLPANMLRKMAQAKFLGLVTDEETSPPAVPSPPPTAAALDAAALDAPCVPDPETLAHEDPDLRLQPHDAARCTGPEPGAGAHDGRER